MPEYIDEKRKMESQTPTPSNSTPSTPIFDDLHIVGDENDEPNYSTSAPRQNAK